jgi:hypothetical protein
MRSPPLEDKFLIGDFSVDTGTGKRKNLLTLSLALTYIRILN